MIRRWIPVSLGSILGLGLMLATSVTDATAQSDATRQEQIERGRYLVNDVAQCVQCHTPRDQAGKLKRTALMHGAPMEAKGPTWVGDLWASRAPDAITFARGRADYLVTLLTTGARPDGTVPKAPMPHFKMSIEDAEAVVAYLCTLN